MVRELAAAEGVNRVDVARGLDLTLVAPGIVEAILAGRGVCIVDQAGRTKHLALSCRMGNAIPPRTRSVSKGRRGFVPKPARPHHRTGFAIISQKMATTPRNAGHPRANQIAA